ncbi:fungal-specific transcription factor domain-containing protein [Mycena maculata]|uniref:Fungal-specific transcription factor domain-containing protein n=1 Tax=Mycena maculata TaxID=230809 RepID=A0AAD7JGB0_9AGAR|nr:fungal-specific transcription factor domain-containing protein [Mycena maculata]
MSPSDEDFKPEFPRGKKRRIERACDVCRRRKSRCDGSQVPGDRCTTCIDADLDCTYVEVATKRIPGRMNTYVDSLETRLEQAEQLIRHLRSELATVRAKCTCGLAKGFSNHDAPHDSNPSSSSGASMASLELMRTALRSLSGPPPPPNGDDFVHFEIARKFEKLAVGNDHPQRHFIGKSSGMALVSTAIDLKADVRRGERRIGSEDTMSYSYRAPGVHWNAAHHRNGNGAANDADECSGSEDGEPTAWTSRRLQFWTFKPWEKDSHCTGAYTFPPTDLTVHLIDLYFTHVNAYVPLLHRPTFERGVKGGLHIEDDGFAEILLLVCAVASRWSEDPRVCETEGSDSADALACGWQWFDQVPVLRRHLFGHATLYDLQYYCLAVQFLEGSSAPHGCWTLLGVGIRLAQDVGAHRRTAHHEPPSVEGELWKRVFWVMVYMDRTISAAMGRTCAIQYDDFDLELPVECDDEYWEHPTQPFQQPPGVPSRVAFFNSLLRLNNVLGFSLRTLYPLNKVKILFSISEDWEEQVVAELDSALNRWRDEVPAHLCWDPTRADALFFDQSVALHCAYYHLQILIHRPFIPMVRTSAPTALPSLAICTSAARACANMVDIQRQRKGDVPVPINLGPVITSGLVLVLNVWSGKRTGLVPDPSREIVNVKKCMEVVRLCETRWQCAGILWDILSELASVGRLPLQNSDALGRKNEQVQRPTDSMNGGSDDTSRNMSGLRGIQQALARPVNDAQVRAQYTQPQKASFAGGIGATLSTQPLGFAPMEPSTFAPTPPPNTWFPPENPFENVAADPQRELDDMMSLIDNDTIAMWTNVPSGFEVDDWGNYFSNLSEITQGQPMGLGGTG